MLDYHTLAQYSKGIIFDSYCKVNPRNGKNRNYFMTFLQFFRKNALFLPKSEMFSQKNGKTKPAPFQPLSAFVRIVRIVRQASLRSCLSRHSFSDGGSRTIKTPLWGSVFDGSPPTPIMRLVARQKQTRPDHRGTFPRRH